ncbi:MAG: hypothetical protein ACRECO_21165 [Xanthobacteraceae bacterium]
MANTPKKMKDPTEAALSAIQDALHIRDAEPQDGAMVAPATTPGLPSDEHLSDKPWPGLRSDPSAQTDSLKDDEVYRPEDTGPMRRAANDDRESIGAILRALQRRPSRTSYLLASIFAGVWVVGAFGLGWLYMPELQAALGPTGLTAPVLALLATIFLAPIVFFYFLAHMAVRSQEMRLIAQSMAEVAMRLAEPETVARESIVTVGQAIRREVAAMGDGIERALARAAELETLVANEVSALEHAYNDNEVRIRALLQDLGGQRDTLVGQAEQIRDAINGVHLDLSHDISQISQLVAEQVNDAARRITLTLAEKGEHITRALGHAGDTMIEQLGERGGDLLERLESTGATTAEAIAQASDRLTATLNFKTDHIGDEFTEIAANLQHMMSVRLDRVADGFSQKSAAVLDMMTGRTQQLTELVVDTGNQLADAISNRVEEVNSSLKTTGDSLVLDLSLRGGDVVAKLEQTGSRITETIVQRGNKVSDTFRESAESLAEVIGTRGDAVREMLAARLQSFEDMFNHGGSELAERIARDSTTLGNLITRHLGEFDRTVKTYGGEMVERLGDRTQEVITAMRDYLDNFDTRVSTKSAEVTTSLDQQFIRFQDALDGRTHTLNEALGSRVMDIAKTLADGGKEVVSALDKRISDVTAVINVRGAKLADALGAKIDDIDKALGQRAMEVAGNLDSRIGRFEELLIGRAEQVTQEIETRSKAAADILNARMEQLSSAIKTNTSDAERAITELTTSSTETIGSRLEQLNVAIKTNTGEMERAIGTLATTTTTVINARLEQLSQSIKTNAGEAERNLTQLASTTTTAIRASAQDAERSLAGMSTGVSNVLKQNATEVERTLLGVSAEVARNFVGKADEITAAVSARSAEMTRLLDEKSSVLINALSGKSQEFSNEVSRVTEHAVKAIEAKGFTFTQTMMDNSEHIARLINEASENATRALNRSMNEVQAATQTAAESSTGAVSRSIKEMQESADAASKNASTTIARTLRELQEQTSSAVEQSKSTAAAAVSEMLETHGMLRSDTTALFERLREANILLQEVLSGAHENMNEIESTLVNRVADFVTAMNDVAGKTGAANSQVEQHIGAFQKVTTQTLGDLSQLAVQFDAHGRSLAEAVALIDRSNRRAEGAINERREVLDTVVGALDSKSEEIDSRLKRFTGSIDQSLSAVLGTLDGKSQDLDQRLTRFSELLDQSLESASDRTREIARLVADATNQGARAISENFEQIRSANEDEYTRTAQAMRSIYEQTTGDANGMLNQAAERFAEVVEGLKRMAAEMQRELDATRTELRKGILELPQETAESAAQMRRVIVDQIEALAELNRIVARHGRGLDAVEPGARRVETHEGAPRREAVLANGGPRPEPRPEPPRARADITGVAPPMPNRRAEAPSLSPAAQGTARTGWLSDLLTRASEPEAPREPPPVAATGHPGEERPARHSIESLDSLAVDIARMIDHDAAAELWDRYKRGERNVFTRKLYTMQGQRAFDEIRRKYRSDRDFMQTVDRYIAEFERLLDEVSRDDRGQVVARTYLTSETGKVYTMLAHAAGRFD